ncbi:hypothetical protein F4811DRAFT_514960 [Daldinia bambusicola]|nr:hypothetical protein F4811DRAFT_514960 [Daldinia bambusicola]
MCCNFFTSDFEIWVKLVLVFPICVFLHRRWLPSHISVNLNEDGFEKKKKKRNISTNYYCLIPTTSFLLFIDLRYVGHSKTVAGTAKP